MRLHNFMRPAQIASIAFLALIFPVAVLVVPGTTWAASGNVQICNPSASCAIGEFLYDDSYNPLTSGASCTITSRYPDGTLFLNNVSLTVSSQGDGWYAHTFTAPSTLGLYRTIITCTVGSDTMRLDKSFEVQTAASTLTSSDVASAVWTYSSRSLTTFGTLISDIWSNSTRTLTGFGTLVADIWSNTTRNLTGAGLDSGSLATKSDVDNITAGTVDLTSVYSSISGVLTGTDTVKTKTDDIKSVADKIKELIEQLKPSTTTTNITNISNLSQDIKNINEENRALLEQIINKPIIESFLENDFNFDFQSKLKETNNLSDKLLVKARYLKSKSSVLDLKWKVLGSSEVISRLAGMAKVTDGILADINKLTTAWDWQVVNTALRQAKEIKSEILSLEKDVKSNGKSAASTQKELKSLHESVAKLETILEKNLLAKLNEVRQQVYALDERAADADRILFSWDPFNLSAIAKKVASLATEVSNINLIPKVNNLLVFNTNKKYSEKELKNKVLSIKGVLSANKKFLASIPGKPLSSLWLEEGSVVFKSLITNPSSMISQTVPVKYYLPAEVKRENIVSVDEGLTINFDAEKDRYFVSGEFTLSPNESKTISVVVDDSVFHISDDEIASIRKQVEELSKPLENTAYFAQGTLLRSDINASLDKVESLQKNGLTPEAKIRAYRESYIEYKAAKEKLEKLKELASQAGSVGTLFGFVGGAQAIAVWGLIIIMAAGFVFLTLYLRSIKNTELAALSQSSHADTFQVHQGDTFPQNSKNSTHLNKKRPVRRYKIITVLLVVGMGLSFLGGVAVSARFHASTPQAEKQQEAINASEAVLGTKKDLPQQYKGEEVTLFVPQDSLVSVHEEPNLDATLVTTLRASQTVFRIGSQDGWVKIRGGGSASDKFTGWVDEDFIEEEQKEEEKTDSQLISQTDPTDFVTIADTPTGFLRVRSGPRGEELTKVEPGSTFPVVDSKDGWSQIVLDDGSLGWVSEEYLR